MDALRRLWTGFREWPSWAQIPVGVLAGLLVLGLVAAPFTDDTDEVVSTLAEGSPTTTSPTTTSPTTSTSTSTTRTSTTLPSTTVASTSAPRRTAPPTTASPPATAPSAAATGGCHSSYSGACVPIASDVDCAGGSGNGPAYVAVKRFDVVGPDVYELDADGDGVACER